MRPRQNNQGPPRVTKNQQRRAWEGGTRRKQVAVPTDVVQERAETASGGHQWAPSQAWVCMQMRHTTEEPAGDMLAIGQGRNAWCPKEDRPEKGLGSYSLCGAGVKGCSLRALKSQENPMCVSILLLGQRWEKTWEVRELGPHTLPYRRAGAAGRPWQRLTLPPRGHSPAGTSAKEGASHASLSGPASPLLRLHPSACSRGPCALAWHGPRVADSSILWSGERTKPMAGAVDGCVEYTLLMGICIFKKLQTWWSGMARGAVTPTGRDHSTVPEVPVCTASLHYPSTELHSWPAQALLTRPQGLLLTCDPSL